MTVLTAEGIEWLIEDFISKISDTFGLKFKCIELSDKSAEHIEAYNKLYNVFIKLGLDPFCFAINNQDKCFNYSIDKFSADGVEYLPKVHITKNNVIAKVNENQNINEINIPFTPLFIIY